MLQSQQARSSHLTDLLSVLEESQIRSIGVAPAEEWGQIDHQGRLRDYLIYTPGSYSDRSPAPLLVVLHGGQGDVRRTADRTGFKPLSEEHGFVVLFPAAANEQWNDGRATTESDVDDVDFVTSLIAHIARCRSIDDEKVFVTGVSNGGIMAQRLACEKPDQFAAYASVTANLPVSLHEKYGKPKKPVSILLINGVDDPLMPWYGGNIRRGRRAGRGGSVLSTEDTFKFWAGMDGTSNYSCHVRHDNAERMIDNSDRVVMFARWNGEFRVVLYGIQGSGHGWPGSAHGRRVSRIAGKSRSDIKASELIWEFFVQQTG